MPEIHINFNAKGLKNIAGMFGTSDPIAVVKMVCGDEDPVELGQTEMVKNTLDPRWMKSFKIDYDPDVETAITVAIYDKKIDSDKKMGSALFDIGGVMAAGDGTEGVKGKKLRSGGTLYCRVTEKYDAGTFSLMLRGIDLKNVEGMFSKSDPFYEVCKNENGEWAAVHRSEFVKNNLSPLWNEAKLDLSTLCDGDLDLPLKIVVYDHEGSGKHKLIGSVETSVSELLGAKRFGGGGDNNDADEANYLLLVDRKDKDAGSLAVINAALIGMPEPEDFSGDEYSDDE